MTRGMTLLFALSLMVMGCATGRLTPKDSVESFLFKNVSVPESPFLARVSYLSTLLEEQFPGGPVRCVVDTTMPVFRMACFEDSRDILPSLKSKIQAELLLNMCATNSGSGAVPWGRGLHDRLQAVSASSGSVDGKSLVFMLTFNIHWAVEYRKDQIIFHLFPRELDVVEYKQKTIKGRRYWRIDDFMLYSGSYAFLEHPSSPERVFVVAPPEVHKEAFTRLEEWRNSKIDVGVLPETAQDSCRMP